METVALQMTLLLCCLVLLSHLPAPVDAATRTSSYRSVSYRSGGTRAVKYSGSVSSIVRARFSINVQTYAMTRGIFYSRYRTRTYYTDSQPTLCVNVVDPLSRELNDSVLLPWYYRNVTVLGIFVCPLDDSFEKTYCCGTELAEYCCTFWDSPSRIAMVAVIIVVFLVVLGYTGFRLHRKFFGLRSPTVPYAAEVAMANVAYSSETSAAYDTKH